jgi:hypothetical protein
MSKELTLFAKDKLPAYLAKVQMDDVTKSLMSGGTSVPRISIRGSVFRKIVGGEEVMKSEDRSMNVIIINSAPSRYRTFYAKNYVEGENAAPSCWSSDDKSPDATVEEPQSKSCADCPKNIKGSGQGDSKACRYSQHLAVLLENDLDGDILQLVLPSQSIFGKGENGKLPLMSYVKFLASHNLPVTTVVTEMRFDLDSATPKLTFKPVRPLTEDEYETSRDRAQEQDSLDAIALTYTSAPAAPKGNPFADPSADEDDEEDEEPAPTPKRKPKPAVKAKPTPVEDDEDDEYEGEVEAPKKRSKPVEIPEEDEPAPPKRKPRPAPVEEDDEPAPAPKRKAKPAPVEADDEPTVRGGRKRADVKDVLSAWADDDDDE